MQYLAGPIERYLRRQLPSARDRARFDRAKSFVDDALARDQSDEATYLISARWLKFLCGRAPVRMNVWPEDARFLGTFAAAFGLGPSQARSFVALGLLGRLWRAWSLDELLRGPPARVALLTRVHGWEYFERSLNEGKGVILLPMHGIFSRLFQTYLRHRGHDGLEVGLTQGGLEEQGHRTDAAKRFELARQMHAAKRRLTLGGIVFNPPDARQNLDNARTIEFFGRQRRLAIGFAELALMTGARVLPIAYRFSPRGHFVMEVGAPFRPLGPDSSHDARIDSLVDQYAAFLRDEWRSYPWNLAWPHLAHYCQLPKVD